MNKDRQIIIIITAVISYIIHTDLERRLFSCYYSDKLHTLVQREQSYQ